MVRARSASSREPSEKEVIAFLEKEFSPEVILLGGSRALHVEKAHSDWDLYLLGDYDDREARPRLYRGEHLDVEVVPFSALPGEVYYNYYGPAPALRVLRESRSGLGRKVAIATRKAYQRGPAPLTKSERFENRDELFRILAKVKSYHSIPEVCFYHLGIFYRLALQQWFQNQARWSLPPHHAMPVLRVEDLELFKLFRALAGPCSGKKRGVLCEKIAQRLWGGK